MVEGFLSVVNADSIKFILGISFLFMLFIGVTDFVDNMRKMGD